MGGPVLTGTYSPTMSVGFRFLIRSYTSPVVFWVLLDFGSVRSKDFILKLEKAPVPVPE